MAYWQNGQFGFLSSVNRVTNVNIVKKVSIKQWILGTPLKNQTHHFFVDFLSILENDCSLFYYQFSRNKNTDWASRNRYWHIYIFRMWRQASLLTPDWTIYGGVGVIKTTPNNWIHYLCVCAHVIVLPNLLPPSILIIDFYFERNRRDNYFYWNWSYQEGGDHNYPQLASSRSNSTEISATEIFLEVPLQLVEI